MKIRGREIGRHQPLFLIAGPCVIESRSSAIEAAEVLREIADRLGLLLVYKSSFDKANRTSGSTFRGPGMEQGLAILAEVRERTGGDMVNIFVDFVGSPVFRATLKALARQGVITTAGWKEGMMIDLVRASECIARHQHVHTHYARYSQGVAAVAFAEEHGWLPPAGENVYGWDEVPDLFKDYNAGNTGWFPVYRIND